MKKFIIAITAVMLCVAESLAHDVEIDGIYYNLYESDKVAEVTYKGDASYEYYEYSGSVTIPETITYNSEIYSVTSIGYSAFSDCSGLTSVTIPNSVTSIGGYAFSGTGIYNNESNWDNGVLYIDNCIIKAKSDVVKGSYTIKKGTRIIGYNAFYYCRGLTSVTIPNSVTSIGSYAFKDCSDLTSVTIPNSVTSIGSSAFYNCSGLTKVNYLGSVDKWVEIDFKDGGASNPTIYAEDLYINNELLTDVKITTADSIKDNAYYGCQNIKTVEIGNSVTSIGDEAFYNCSGLTEVTIGNSVTSIGEDAFSSCSGLTSVTIPNSVTSIGGGAFNGCSGLTSVTIGNSVTSIGDEAFYNCSGLTSVTIPNSVKYIGEEAFYNTGIYNSESNRDNGVLYVDNCLIKANSGVVKGSYTIKEGTRVISGAAFISCSGLTSVTIPTSVTSIGSSAFEGCSGLTSVTIPTSVTSIGYSAFSDCSGLTSVVWNAKNCEDFSSSSYALFYDIRSNITSFTFGNEVERIPAYLCSEMKNLKEVTIPNSVTSIGQYAFEDCNGLTEVTIGNSVTSIGFNAFYVCSGLTKVNYLGTVDKWVEFDWFYSNSNPTYYAKDLYINNELLTDVKITTADSIKKYAFYKCK